jgi:hypothetical protein
MHRDTGDTLSNGHPADPVNQSVFDFAGRDNGDAGGGATRRSPVCHSRRQLFANAAIAAPRVAA